MRAVVYLMQMLWDCTASAPVSHTHHLKSPAEVTFSALAAGCGWCFSTAAAAAQLSCTFCTDGLYRPSCSITQGWRSCGTTSSWRGCWTSWPDLRVRRCGFNILCPQKRTTLNSWFQINSVQIKMKRNVLLFQFQISVFCFPSCPGFQKLLTSACAKIALLGCPCTASSVCKYLR